MENENWKLQMPKTFTFISYCYCLLLELLRKTEIQTHPMYNVGFRVSDTLKEMFAICHKKNVALQQFTCKKLHANHVDVCNWKENAIKR